MYERTNDEWKEGKKFEQSTKANERKLTLQIIYEGWNFNSGNYLFTTDTK